MSWMIKDLGDLYRYTFGTRPYVVGEAETMPPDAPIVLQGNKVEISQLSGSALTANYLGKEIWLPVRFLGLDAAEFGAAELLLPYAVVKVSSSKTIVRTPLAERKGTVKELFSADDYKIMIKGFVIDETNRVWPERELTILKKLDDLNTAIQIDNALTNIFLDQDTRVVITALELPEVEGGRNHIRPFSMTLESDSIFTLQANV